MEYSAKAGAKQKTNQAGNETKPWIRRLGRFGYMAKGTVYFLIGLLALMAALGLGGKMTGTSGMLETVAGKPFGEILLWLIGIGLIGYVIWEVIKTILDPENKGTDAKGLLTRAGYGVSAIIYGGIAFKAISIAMHASSGGGGGSEKTISAKLLAQPFGQWIIGLVGMIIIGYGVYELYNGYTERFMNKFRVSEMNQHEKKIARKSGKMGLIARGAVLAMIGYFFIQTAITANPEQSKGIDGALAELASKPYGQWLLGIAAAGLMLYGIYEVIRGRYEHMSFGGK
ncbi:DUF1206 domain-containing protein [Metabacillus idriensis]|uniref:DUF1206 domain-containing protein n=1 Tax=Metabacillus idriensis TaxID=324768 RepID=A0A6I2M696_9BACI|nr:DUF1206 domain-containing protein [Metabacillus idriensis]MCM3595071.1 DUF1206 domain-containing protein [Metabacillus idriensis]MRX52902.1 DUF1206 domain-containing protein [Metabacillus idriensis]OHR65528.1 hypothetical protein HMPREF3291_02830 [Bacillus sp. HMSC76G11]